MQGREWVLGPVGVVQRRQEQHAWDHLRARCQGEQIDASLPAIYPTHVDKISEALMKEGSDHTAIVNITQLTTLFSGARPCEPEYLSLEEMKEDDEFRVTKGPLPQIKTKTTKVYSIPPASHCHRSWHLAWGDYLSYESSRTSPARGVRKG
jgi:hypothetical protein